MFSMLEIKIVKSSVSDVRLCCRSQLYKSTRLLKCKMQQYRIFPLTERYSLEKYGVLGLKTVLSVSYSSYYFIRGLEEADTECAPSDTAR